MSNSITDIEIRELLTPSDVLDAQDAGIIPDGSYTLRNEEVILQNREIYEWLKSKDDPRFIDTIFSNDINQEILSKTVPNNGEEELPVYLIKSSIPSGPRGDISFEFKNGKEGEIKSLLCKGNLYPETYDNSIFTIKEEILTSENYEYLPLAEKVVDNINLQIENNNITPDFGKISIVKTSNEPPQNFYFYTLKGKVTDGTNPLSNVAIEDDNKNIGVDGSITYSNPNGEFTLKGEYLKSKKFNINLSLKDFISKTKSPFTKTSSNILTLPPDLGVIVLSKASFDQSIVISNSHLQDSQTNSIVNAKKLQDPGGFATGEILNKIISNAKTILLPYALTQIAKFGITNAPEALGKSLDSLNISCPSNLDTLNKIIKQKNSLTKQLNNIFENLKDIKVAVEVADQVITVASIVASTLSTLILAFPTIPFAPDPLKPITSKIPQATGKLKSVIEIIADTLAKMKIISSSILLILTILIQIIQEILNYLSLLDQLIEKCAIDGALPQENISSDLLAATEEQSQQLSPVVTDVNGFAMAVVDVEGATNQGLKRRKAIARNKAGIIMLEGEPSFSSNDQILIDELVYYIQTNDLKAD